MSFLDSIPGRGWWLHREDVREAMRYPSDEHTRLIAQATGIHPTNVALVLAAAAGGDDE